MNLYIDLEEFFTEEKEEKEREKFKLFITSYIYSPIYNGISSN